MNKRRVKTFRLWAVAATVGSLLALNAGHLRAENVTYKPGAHPRAGRPQTESVAAGNLTLTDKGFAIRGYMQLGWSTRRVPIVRSQAAEASVQPLYRIGDTFALTQDTTLYAVWAADVNNSGHPDYYETGTLPRPTPAYMEKLQAELKRRREAAEKGITLRSLPEWDIDNDQLADADRIYSVGCWYNDTLNVSTTEQYIRFKGNRDFTGEGILPGVLALKDVKARLPMELVFEYGGVLEDSCLTGGPDQKPITRIPFPYDNKDSSVLKLFSYDRMMFTRIQKDGEAVLKLYFVKPGTNELVKERGYWNIDAFTSHAWSHLPSTERVYPFTDPQTGAATDTLTFRFQIYNPAKFKSDVLNQILLYKDSVDFGHVSGMPMKYMSRSFDGGFTWHPATAPLSEVEKDLVEDSARVCLRELDNRVGYSAFLKSVFLNPEEYHPSLPGHTIDANLIGAFENEKLTEYMDSVYRRFPSAVQEDIKQEVENILSTYVPPTTWEDSTARGAEILTVIDQCIIDSISAIPYTYLNIAPYVVLLEPNFDGLVARDIARERAHRDWNAVVGQREADKVVVPDRCRPDHCFYFGTLAPPVLNRQVFIPEVEGATVMPGYGNFYVPSQNDFRFTVKYAGKPMIVTTNRTIDGKPEVLVGSLNANGEYEYLIRRVTQEIRLTFTADVSASTVADATVWAAGGAIRIHAAKAEAVSVYSAAGRLVKRLTLSAGDTMIPVESGLYLVVFADGTSHKIAVR